METQSTPQTPPPPPPPPAGTPVPPAAPPARDKDERMWAMFCHLSALAGHLIWWLPFANVIGPLAIWLIKREQYPFVNEQGKESLNFQISMAIVVTAARYLIYVYVGIPIVVGLGLFNLVCVILATVKSNTGESYRYPISLRLIK